MFNQDNAQRDKLIFDIVEFKKMININGKDGWTWNDVSIMIGKDYGIVVTPNACRKAYKRYCDKINSEETKEKYGINYYSTDKRLKEPLFIDGDKLSKPKEKQFISVEIKQDGTQISERRIVMSETDSKSPEFCLTAHGFDPKLWEVVSVKNNFWDSAFGEGEVNTLYQSKLIVKPKGNKELTLEDINNAIKKINANDINRNHELIKFKQNGKAFMVDVADLHVGSLSWHEQVGNDNDYKIAFGNLKSVVSQISDVLKQGKHEELVLDFLGDFLHVDTSGLTTSGGTPVDTDSRPEKMIMKAYEMVMFIIDNLAMLPTKVKWVGGNHSKLVEFAIFQSLPRIYANVKHIEFDVSPMDRKVWTYGVNIVGLLHGDEISKEEKTVWLQRDFKAEWSNSKYAEIHCGHFHQEQLFKEVGGITHRTNPTLKIQDKYEYDHGWSSTKVILGYSWDKENGLEQVYYFK